MKKNAVLLACGAAALVAIGAATYYWQRAEARHQLVLAAVHLPIEVPNASPILRARLDEISDQLKTRRHDVEALGQLSAVFHANGFMTEAAQCYSQLERLQPSEARWWYRHAIILAGYGDLEPAIPLLQRAIECDGSYTPARLRLADGLLKANRLEQASALYQEIVKRAPDSTEAHYATLSLARIDWEAGRLTQARDRLEPLVKQTNYQLGYDLIVDVYERLGQRDRAEAIRAMNRASGAYRDPSDPWIDDLIEDSYDSYRIALAAGTADRLGNMDTAVQLLERACQYSPDDVSPRFQLATLYLQHGKFREALPHLQRCVSMAPTFADGWAHLSNALEELGDPNGARVALMSGLSNCPDSPGLHLMYARQLEKSGQPERAIEEFKTSIRLRPNEAEAYVELGNTLIRHNRVDEGVEQMKASLVAEPENPTALGVLAFHAISTRNEANARGWMQRVIRQPRTPPEQLQSLLAAYQQTFGHEP